jgi:tRNA (mo5U34)-methyltransferase
MHSIESLQAAAHDFSGKITAQKISRSDIHWYPYTSLSNIEHLLPILPVEMIEALSHGTFDARVLDIGAADGDLGYFFESRGAHVDFLDYAPTNYNDCKGLQTQKVILESMATINEQNIDQGFLLDGQYDFAMALGLLYHLRNPFLFLMTLASHAERMVLSTRVARKMGDHDVHDISLAYVLDTRESNNDPTNYWTFSPKGLMVTLKRSGWIVKEARHVGCTPDSNPVDADKDERMFVYCERVQNWRDLWLHHDF